jgi:hypothetical protein
MRLTLLAVAALSAAAQNFDVALIGDMPYTVANEPRFERLIADINRQTVDFTVHIGDTKAGSTRCDNSYYPKVLGWFNSFDTGLLYTPGDNEWTDCMRTNNGGFDPLDRLALVRKTFYPTNQTLGRRPLTVMRQSEESKYALYVENAMLTRGPVVFATLHAVGSNNNLQYTTVAGAKNPFYDNDAEFKARNEANVAWLKKVFATARTNKSLGVLIAAQANMFDGFFEAGTGSTRSGFEDIIKTLREETLNFKGEVVLVSGDSHYMRIDKPLTDRFPACTAATGDCKPFDAALDQRGARVLNFTRVEVPGSADVHWVMCHVRPNSRNLFQFEFMIVPNVPTGAAVTAAIAGPATVESNSPQVALDASGSTSPNSGDLTFAWSVTPGYPQAAIVNANTATPVVQLSTRGQHKFTVKVTDRTGASATADVNVRYY